MKTTFRNHLVILSTIFFAFLLENKAFSQTAIQRTASSVTFVEGGKDWSNLSNLSSNDNAYATVQLSSNGDNTDYLHLTNFNFNIPTNATILGVRVLVRRFSSNSSSANNIFDQTAQLIVGGSRAGDNKANLTKWGSTEEQIIYGSSTDNWGQALTPAIINNTNFGFAFRLTTNTSARIASVDEVIVEVNYIIARQYKSKASSDFNNPSTWLVSSDGITWTDATTAPSVYDLSVSIESPHTVTVSADVTSDQVTIKSGGTVNVNSSINWTIANGTGADLTVNGTLSNSGTITQNSGSELVFNSGSTYNHVVNSATIPTATWNPASTINVTGASTTLSAQTYGIIKLDNSSTLIPSGDAIIKGNLTITTGTFLMTTNNSVKRTLNVEGNLSIATSAVFDFGSGSSGNGQIASVLNLTGNLTASGTGKIYTSSNNAFNGIINFVGTTQSITFGDYTQQTFIDYVVNAGSTVTVLQNVGLSIYNNNVNFQGTFDVLSGGVLNLGNNSIVALSGSNGTANFNLKSGGKLITANATGLTGSIPASNMNLTFENLTSYEFNASGIQTTGILPSSITSLDLTGSGAKTISNSSKITINGRVRIESGSSMIIATGVTHDASSFLYGSTSGTAKFYGGANAPFNSPNFTSYTITVSGTSTKYPAEILSSFFGSTTGLLKVSSPAALPVTLSNFTTKPTTDNKVNLAWVTASESNNKGFRIERQSEGEEKFSSLGFIPSKAEGGNSQVMIAYSFRDITAKMGTNTYRLVQEDLDGKQTISEVRMVKLSGQTVVSLYPNPTQGAVTINRTNDGKKMNIQVIDLAGRIISQYQNITDSNYRLNLPQSGVYHIKLMYPETGEQSIQRIVVQK